MKWGAPRPSSTASSPSSRCRVRTLAKIEAGRWSEQLRRMLGMAGVTSVAAELAPEVSPTIELEGQSVEWNFLKAVRDVYVGQTIAGSALNISKWRFRNPVDSGVVAVMEYVELVPTGGTAVLALNVSQVTVDLDTVQPTAVPDSRWGPLTTGRSALVVTFQNSDPTVPGGQAVATSRALDSVAWQYPREILLLPGVALDAGSQSINRQVHGTFKWRERHIPVLER